MNKVDFPLVALSDEIKYMAGLSQALFGRLLRQAEVFAIAPGALVLDGAIASYVESPEFIRLYGTPRPTNAEWADVFLDRLYENLFAREFDVGGKSYWLGQMLDGTLSVSDVVKDFLVSAEFQTNVATQISNWYDAFVAYGDRADEFVVGGSFSAGDMNYAQNGVYSDFSAPTQEQINIAGLYQGLFGRLADSGGFHYWETVYAASGLEAVINGMFKTPEFLNMYGQPNPQNPAWATNFTKLLYNDFFARNSEPYGIQYWARRMISGELTAQQVTQLFLESSEFQLRTTQPILDWYQSFYAYGSGELADQYVFAGSRSGYRPDHPNDPLSSKAIGINGVYGVHVELSINALSGDIGPAYVLLDPNGLADQFTLVGVQGRNPSNGVPDPALYPSTMSSNFKGLMSFDATDVQFITLSQLNAQVTLHGVLDTQISQSNSNDQSGYLLTVNGDATGRVTVISTDAEVDVAGYSNGPASLLVDNAVDVLLHTGQGEATIVADGSAKVTIDADAGTAALDAGRIILKGTSTGDVEILSLENDLTLSNVAQGFGITGAVNVVTADVDGLLTVQLGDSAGHRTINAKAMNDDGDKLVVTGTAASHLHASISNADFDSTGYAGDVDLLVCNTPNETLNIATNGGNDAVTFDPTIVAATESPAVVKLLGDGSVVDLDGGQNTLRFDILNATGAGPAPDNIILAGAGSLFSNLDDLAIRIDDDQGTTPNANIQVEADLGMMTGVNTITLETGHVALDVNDSDKSFLLRGYAGEDAAPAITLRSELVDEADYDHNTVDRLGVIAKNPGKLLELHLSSYSLATNIGDIAIKTAIYDAASDVDPALRSLLLNVDDSYNRIIDLDHNNQQNFDSRLTLIAEDGNQPEGFQTQITLLGVRAAEVHAERVVRTDVEITLADNSDHVVWLAGGNDTVHGSVNNDHIYANSGDDVVYAGLGADAVYTGYGQDYVEAGAGDDTVVTGDDDDAVIAGLGNDFVDGGLGADYIELSALPVSQPQGNDEDDDHNAQPFQPVVLDDGSDIVRYDTGDTLLSAKDSYLSVGQNTMDQIAGFDFSSLGDKFELSYLSANFQANSVNLKLCGEPLDVAQEVEAYMLGQGCSYLNQGETDALLLHVSWKDANLVKVEKDFLIVNTDQIAGYQAGETGDLTVELLSSWNSQCFSTANFITNNLVV